MTAPTLLAAVRYIGCVKFVPDRPRSGSRAASPIGGPGGGGGTEH